MARKTVSSRRKKKPGILVTVIPGEPVHVKAKRRRKKRPAAAEVIEEPKAPPPTVKAPPPKKKPPPPSASFGAAVSLKHTERNMDLMVEAAKEAARPPLNELLDEIRARTDEPDLIQARSNLDGMVWASQRKYEEVTHVHIKRADAYGHLETAQRRDRIIDADGFCQLVPIEGLKYFEKRRVISPEEWAYADDKMRRKAFSIARATEDYHIQYVKEMIEEVLRGELDERYFRKRMANMLGTSHRDYYIETVYRTNMQSAYAHGRYVQQRIPEVLNTFPLWQYRTVGDSRVRDSHAAMDGRIWPANHQIWDIWYPPNGYSCRCRVDELTKDEAGDKVEQDMPDEMPDERFANSPRDWLEREF
jgi:SPP1 gp7 family putative phage head morphogenesis protein